MTDHLPSMDHGIDESGRNVVIVAERVSTHDLSTLLELAPGLLRPEAATRMAQAVTHLAAGADYRVIDSPPDFEAAYRGRLAQEGPAAPRIEGMVRLSDHGVPDFAAVHAPAYAGTTLAFFATSTFSGLPYRVELDPTGAAAAGLTPDIFRAVALKPLPPAPAASRVNPEYVGALGTPLELELRVPGTSSATS